MTPPLGSNRAGLVSQIGDAIPDSENLHAAYDFGQEDGTLPVSDQSDNGRQLGTGDYTGVSADINGNQAGEFDGTDDLLEGPTFGKISSWTVYTVIELASNFTTDKAYQFLSFSDTNLVGYRYEDRDKYSTSNSPWAIYAGSNLEGSSDSSKQLLTGVFNGSNSEIREDGTSENTGDVGSSSYDAIGVGARLDSAGRYFEGAIGEILIYDTVHGKSTIGKVESYLSDKWGVSI